MDELNSFFRSGTVLFTGLIGLMYIFDPAPTRLGLIDDSIPYFGDLDIALATVLVLASLRYFGLDPLAWLWPPLSGREHRLRAGRGVRSEFQPDEEKAG